MPRYFTLQEAEKLIPNVASHVRRAQSTRTELQQAEEQMQKQKFKVAMAGGSVVNVNRAFALRDQRQHALERLKKTIEEITEMGCQFKDLDQGLIDFPTLYNGDEVLMCWKLGEDRIDYWHGLEEGYAGRKKIDDHFRENHRGDWAA